LEESAASRHGGFTSAEKASHRIGGWIGAGRYGEEKILDSARTRTPIFHSSNPLCTALEAPIYVHWVANVWRPTVAVILKIVIKTIVGHILLFSVYSTHIEFRYS
jgi:hypothetical protein